MGLIDGLLSVFGGARRGGAADESGSADFRRRHAALETALHRSGLGSFEGAIRDWLSASGAAGAAVYDERGIPCALARSGALEPEGLSDPARLWGLLRRDEARGALKVVRQTGLTVVAGRVEVAGTSWHLLTWHAV